CCQSVEGKLGGIEANIHNQSAFHLQHIDSSQTRSIFLTLHEPVYSKMILRGNLCEICQISVVLIKKEMEADTVDVRTRDGRKC
ncbi:hypothetical protein PMAYCL1PPCAC_27477, partial [Pristionchus mayeri]